MEQITEHFSRKEFDCHDGTPVPDQYQGNLLELCKNLEVLRAHLGKPILITSGFRSKSWNKKQGGATSSQHLTASAADIKIPGVSTSVLAHTIEALIGEGKMKQGGIGVYNSWVHYDIRGTKARWDFRK